MLAGDAAVNRSSYCGCGGYGGRLLPQQLVSMPLLTVAEALQAMRKAGEVRGVYQPPATTT